MSKRLIYLALPLLLAGMPWASANTVEPLAPLELDCLIEPRITTDISTRAQGVVEQFYVDRGDVVEKGQILVTLDAAIENASVALAKARAELIADIEASKTSLAYGQRKVTRFDGLYQQKAVAAHTLDEARTEALLAAANLKKAREDRRVAELQLQQAVETLELRTIRSPISGVVIDRLLAVGESVEDQPIIQVAQIDPLYVEAIAPVQYFSMIKQGAHGVVRPEQPIGGEYMAIVKVVDQVIEAASGTFRIRLELPNQDRALPAGLKCRVTFPPAQRNFPQKAAQNRAPEDFNAVTAAPSQPVEPGAQTDEVEDLDAVTALDSQPVEPGAQTDEVEDLDAVTALDRCFTVGPISDAARAHALVAEIDPQLVDFAIRETAKKKTNGYVVHSAPQPSLQAARRLERQLRNKGVEDLAVIRSGSLANHLSFGVYNRKTFARQRCRQMSALGVSCHIKPRPAADTLVWVDLAFKSPPSDLGQLQDWLRPNDLLDRVNPQICNPDRHAEAP